MARRKALASSVRVPFCGAIAGLVAVAALLVVATPSEAVVRYVAPNGADTSDCTSPAAPCASPQWAVESSGIGDEIRLAKGTYTGVTMRPSADTWCSDSVFQVLYITRSVTVRGGFTTSDWQNPDPVKNLTTIDAEGLGRVVYVALQVAPTLEGLRLTGGNATGQLGWEWGMDAGSGVYSNGARLTIDNCQIVGNGTLDGVGGGVALVESPTEIRNCAIVDNRAETGGGVALKFSNASVLDSTFSANQAAYSGGGLHARSSRPLIQGNAFISNLAGQEDGGAVGVRPTSAASAMPAVGAGGAMSFEYSPAEVSSNTIFANHAGASGGAMELIMSSCWFDGNVIRHNTAGLHSGAIAMMYNSNSWFVNNVIADNGVVEGEPALGARGEKSEATTSAAGSGPSAIDICSSSPTFQHNTIARNSGAGGAAISICGGNPTPISFVNDIIASHVSGITVGAGSTARIEGVLWHDNGANTAGDGAFDNLWSHFGAPDFINPGAGNYHVARTSAAIDWGASTNRTVDFDLDARPVGAAPDIGADEYPTVFEGAGAPPASGTSALAARAGQTSGYPTYDAIIAAAANTGGVNLTRWLTDVDLFYTPLVLQIAGGGGTDLLEGRAAANGNEGTVEIALLKANQANPTPTTVQVQVPGGQTTRLANLLGSLFTHSNAALGIRWLSGWGETNSRFYNTASACGGTYGMFIPAERPHDALVFGNVAYFHHLSYSPSSGSGFRTNMGFANGTDRQVVVEIVLYGDNGVFLGSKEQTLRAYEHLQITRIHKEWGLPAVSQGYAVVWVKTPGAWVHVYAMLIDNVSGDPVYLRPLLEAPAAFGSRYDVMLSAAANTTGLNQTRWLTDDDLVNPLAFPAVVQLDLLRANQGNPTPAVAQFVIPPRQTLRLTDVLGSTFSAGNAAVGVKLLFGWAGVNSRFYNTASACGGTYGMYIPGHPRKRAISANETAFFHHVSYSTAANQGFRTNVGFANNTGLVTAVVVSLFGDDGSFLATTTVTLQPWEHRQITRIHKELGTGSVTHGSISVSVTTAGGAVHAYAMLIDNVSGDPIYMLPALTERPLPFM